MEGRGLTRHIRVDTVFGSRPQTASEARECHAWDGNLLNQCLESAAQSRAHLCALGRGSATAVGLLFAPLSTLGEFGNLLLASHGLRTQPQPYWIFRSIYESQPMDYKEDVL